MDIDIHAEQVGAAGRQRSAAAQTQSGQEQQAEQGCVSNLFGLQQIIALI
jgi:hypothetical protein